MCVFACVCVCRCEWVQWTGVQSKHLNWNHLDDLENQLLCFVQHSCLFMMHNVTTLTRLNSIKYKSIYRLLFPNCTFLIEPKKLTFEVCVCVCVFRYQFSTSFQFSLNAIMWDLHLKYIVCSLAIVVQLLLAAVCYLISLFFPHPIPLVPNQEEIRVNLLHWNYQLKT